jgi:hypothetical protein
LLSTTFAGIFTLPLSAYFFGVFSTVSPLTNIICVKPAFWSLISGVIATAVSFIPQNITQLIAIFIFILLLNMFIIPYIGLRLKIIISML